MKFLTRKSLKFHAKNILSKMKLKLKALEPHLNFPLFHSQ
jgi:hypothetical protein